MNKPGELVWAETVDYLCHRYGCLPSALAKEDAGILRMLAIVAAGAPDGE